MLKLSDAEVSENRQFWALNFKDIYPQILNVHFQICPTSEDVASRFGRWSPCEHWRWPLHWSKLAS